MATDPFEHSAFLRLNSISDELLVINAEILANLDVLPQRTEMVMNLISRCDRLALDLDAIKLRLAGRADWPSADAVKSYEPSADGSERVY